MLKPVWFSGTGSPIGRRMSNSWLAIHEGELAVEVVWHIGREACLGEVIGKELAVDKRQAVDILRADGDQSDRGESRDPRATHSQEQQRALWDLLCERR